MLKLFNIQITSGDIFICHYFWNIPGHIHKLRVTWNKLWKCWKCVHTAVRKSLYIFLQEFQDKCDPNGRFTTILMVFRVSPGSWTRINTPFLLYLKYSTRLCVFSISMNQIILKAMNAIVNYLFGAFMHLCYMTTQTRLWMSKPKSEQFGLLLSVPWNTKQISFIINTLYCM